MNPSVEAAKPKRKNEGPTLAKPWEPDGFDRWWKRVRLRNGKAETMAQVRVQGSRFKWSVAYIVCGKYASGVELTDADAKKAADAILKLWGFRLG